MEIDALRLAESKRTERHTRAGVQRIWLASGILNIRAVLVARWGKSLERRLAAVEAIVGLLGFSQVKRDMRWRLWAVGVKRVLRH